jgi:hypothetical protein
MKIAALLASSLLAAACATGAARGGTPAAPDGSISGVVRDDEGRPVQGAVAAAHRPVDADSVRRFALTDSAGRFVIRGLPRGSYSVRVTSLAHRAAELFAEVNSEPTYLAVSLASSPEVMLCTMDYRAGMAIRVFDLWSGRPAADSAVAWAEAGSYRDSLQVTASDERTGQARVLSGAYERPGEYTVTITRPGYQTWQQPVTVRRAPCHVVTAQVRANLVPLRPGSNAAAPPP